MRRPITAISDRNRVAFRSTAQRLSGSNPNPTTTYTANSRTRLAAITTAMASHPLPPIPDSTVGTAGRWSKCDPVRCSRPPGGARLAPATTVRPSIEAVTGISFTVRPGERLAFIGPNGAGKSTSIKMLTGILRPTGGAARVLGLVPWNDRLALTRRIGALFGQRSQLWNELPPRDGYRMLGAIHGLDTPTLEATVSELGERFAAADLFDQPVRTLSLGQRDLNETLGVTVFLTSHDVADIEHMADRAIVVNHGEIIHDDTVAAMRRSLLRTKRVEVTFDHAIDTTELGRRLARDLGSGVTMTGLGTGREAKASTTSTATVEVDTGRHRIRTVLDHILVDGRVVDLTVIDPPLEQVIGEIYRRPTAGDRP
jgi:ABC-2 type transport system ATP-binding protein